MTRTAIQLRILPDSPARRHWRFSCLVTAAVAAVFIALIAGILIGSVFREHEQGLLITKRIEDLKIQLRANDTDESIKNKIRDADDELRQVYFARRGFWLRGAWMLLGAGVVLGTSLKVASDLGYRPFMPQGPVPAGPQLNRPMKIGLGLICVLTVAFFIGARMPGMRGLQFSTLTNVPQPTGPQPVGPIAPTVKADPPATDEELAKNWPMFRGPGGFARAAGEYPTKWDAAAGKGVMWKTPIPLLGNNSPLVWENNIFVAGASEDKREIYCLDATSGKIRWTAPIAKPAGPKIKIGEDTGWAPSTMATDGRRVFSIFPAGDLAAVDFAGKVAWTKSLGSAKNNYGHASSLAFASGLLIVQFDQGLDLKETPSMLLGLDPTTGKEVWKTPRPVRSSWTTPIVAPAAGGLQIVTSAEPWIIGYDLKTGGELWRAKGLTGDVAPTPAFEDGTAYAVQERGDLLAVKMDGKGDVTATHRRKLDVEELPDITSPLVFGGRLYVGLASRLSCSSAADGKLIWEKDVEGGFHASPVAVGKYVYVTDKAGITHIIEPADEAKEIAANPLGEAVNATPAFVGGRIYIRGLSAVYCIGK